MVLVSFYHAIILTGSLSIDSVIVAKFESKYNFHPGEFIWNYLQRL